MPFGLAEMTTRRNVKGEMGTTSGPRQGLATLIQCGLPVRALSRADSTHTIRQTEVRELSAPFAQQCELVELDTFVDESDTEAMIGASPTAQIVQRARHFLELVIHCNEAGKTSAFGVEIFKPTTRLMTVFGDLPWLAATDRLRFGDVVDCLYFIFYEDAGKEILRFLDKHGGPRTQT